MKNIKNYNFLNKAIGNASHPLSICLSLLLLFLVVILIFNADTNNTIFTIAALTAGWIVAFYTTYWNQKRNFINNLKYEAAKSIVQSLSNVSSDLINLKSSSDGLITRIELAKGSTGKLHAKWGETQKQIKRYFNRYSENFLKMLCEYEESEILFLDLRKLINIFCKNHGNLSNSYYRFHSTLDTMILMHSEIPNNEEYSQKLKEEASRLSSLCLDMVGYCQDLRVELLNRTIGVLVNKQVERRKPGDPNCKILSELVD